MQDLQPVPGKSDRLREGYVTYLWEGALRGHAGVCHDTCCRGMTVKAGFVSRGLESPF